MVSSLDPHSQYFDKKSFKEFKEGTSGKFVGVGIEITQEDGLVKVVGECHFQYGLKGLWTRPRRVARSWITGTREE